MARPVPLYIAVPDEVKTILYCLNRSEKSHLLQSMTDAISNVRNEYGSLPKRGYARRRQILERVIIQLLWITTWVERDMDYMIESIGGVPVMLQQYQ